MSSNGILLTFWTISAICGCSSLSVPGAVGMRTAPSPPIAARPRRPGDEVERDIELAGEQVAGAQLRAQAAGDELLQDDGIARAVGIAQQRLAHRAEAQRIDVGQRPRPGSACAARRTGARRCGHGRSRRRAGRSPAPGARPRTDWSKIIRTGTATPSAGASAERRSAKSVKTVFSGAGGARAASGGASKARPPASTEASVCVLTLRPLAFSVRSMPLAFQKRRVQRHELLVRRLDEDLHRQLVAVGIERVADDAADRRAAMEHRRADVERAEVLGAQHEDRARLAAQHEGRRLEADELAARLGRDAGVGADVGAREAACRGRSRRRRRCAAARPRTSVSSTAKRRRRAVELDDDDDALPVVAQGDRDDLADHDLLVADLGLAGLDAVGRLELDLDRAGRRGRCVRTSIEAAIAIATTGTSQTRETFQRRALTTRGCGHSGAGIGTGAARLAGG